MQISELLFIITFRSNIDIASSSRIKLGLMDYWISLFPLSEKSHKPFCLFIFIGKRTENQAGLNYILSVAHPISVGCNLLSR